MSEAPELRIINPDATPEEVAAITAVFAAMSSATSPEPKKSAHTWAAHTRKMRTTLRRGPGAWRASGLP